VGLSSLFFPLPFPQNTQKNNTYYSRYDEAKKLSQCSIIKLSCKKSNSKTIPTIKNIFLAGGTPFTGLRFLLVDDW
jgi:hypothetical protein